MTQRKMLRKAFITVIGTVALGSGCTNTVTTEGEACAFGDPGCEASCPTAKPASGVPCSQSGQECWYSNGECEDFIATCKGTWTVDLQVSSCNPPPPDPECPEELPIDGTGCDAGWEPYVCHGYLDPLCGLEVSATCNGTWTVDQVACNPPPPDLCWSAVDETACAAVGFCSWLVPACSGNTLPAAGCFPADGCNTCWGDCLDVDVHPCPDESCNSCSIGQQVCAAPNG